MELDKQNICQQLQQCSNIAAMVAAGSILALFFENAGFIGFLLSVYCIYLSIWFIKRKNKIEEGV